MSNSFNDISPMSHSGHDDSKLLNTSSSSLLRKPLGTSMIGKGSSSKFIQKSKSSDMQTIFKCQAVKGVLDLSNKNLKDMHSNELAQCIKGHSGHIRVLNLSENKIGDEGLVHIIKALCESQIEEVNFSGNQISEKHIDSVVGSLKTHKMLKRMNLINNGIKSRLVKNKLKNALAHIDVLV